MLSELSICNYALIDSLHLNFNPGLTIITGETGAGKSIMLGALSLVMGARADSKVVGPCGAKAVVEARFSRLPSDVREMVIEAGLDYSDDELIVRREISQSGRSRAFVNDSPTNLTFLSLLASRLIDIHSQHSNLLLSQSSSQLAIIDAFAGNSDIVEKYRADFRCFASMRHEIIRMRHDIEEARKNRDFLAFQLEQLNKINPRPGELEKVEREFDILSDADEIRESLSEAYSLIEGRDDSVGSMLADASEAINRMPENFFSDSAGEDGRTLPQRLAELRIELKDIAESLAGYLDNVHSDPALLSKMSARMNVLYEAQRNFKVSDHESLVDLHEQLKSSVASAEQGDDCLHDLEAKAMRLGGELKIRAEEISASRMKAAVEFADLLTERARPLGLINLNFEVNVSQGKLTLDGRDHVEFACAFNKNQTLRPMIEIASGGEISRLMLCIKGIMAGKMNLPTVIFDEVDTGVSGEIADKMGATMAGMARSMQVMAITHLPQVASKGDAHLKVYKTDREERTVTHVDMLSPEMRVTELARMLSGSEVSEASLANARELLSGR